MKNKDSIKNIITSKFKDNLWDDKELEGKSKLRYYKEVIKPTLANWTCLFVLNNVKKKMNIARIKSRFHELHSKNGSFSIPKTPSDKRICHLYDTKRVDDKK